jgi:hypothetical protein
MAPRTSSGAVSWRHDGSGRLGLETAYFVRRADGWLFNGTTEATEEGRAWTVAYQLIVGHDWLTRRAHVTLQTAGATHETLLTADGGGHWHVDGAPAPHLDGCLDVDLESSALTNAFPVRRLGLAVGDSAAAPAAYVRVAGLRVQRLDQRYTRLADDEGERYDYVAPAFDVRCVVAYDDTGFVQSYPDIAVRV